MNKLIALSLMLSIALTSCKKDSTNNPNSAGSNNTSSSTGYTNSLTAGSSVGCYGFLINTITSLPDSSIPGGFRNEAYFAPVPKNNLDAGSYVTVSSVDLNGTAFSLANGIYSPASNQNISGPLIWNVAGAGIIPSFTYTNTNAYPKYQGFYSLPDTIHKNSGLAVTLSGLANTDTAYFSITDGTHTVTQNFNASTASITFSASSLAPINSTPSIFILCTKNNIQTFSSKNFNFCTNNYYHKTVKLVP